MAPAVRGERRGAIAEPTRAPLLYAALFIFAHRALCAAAILLRPAERCSTHGLETDCALRLRCGEYEFHVGQGFTDERLRAKTALPLPIVPAIPRRRSQQTTDPG